MTVNLKTSVVRTFSTPTDVVREIAHLKTEDLDFSGYAMLDPVRQTGQLHEAIIKGDAFIEAALKNIYGGLTGLRVTPWITPPMPDPKNTGDLKLVVATGGTLIADAYTAGWQVEFTSTTQFKLTSSIEGAQGTGLAFASDQSSTNTDITIGSNAWATGDSAVNKGDKYYFSVIDVDPMIWALSVRYGIVGTEQSITADEDSRLKVILDGLRSEANGKLRRLQRPQAKDGLQLRSYSKVTRTSLGIDYFIDDLGFNQSTYLEAELDRTNAKAYF